VRLWSPSSPDRDPQQECGVTPNSEIGAGPHPRIVASMTRGALLIVAGALLHADAAVVTAPGFGYAIAIVARQVEDTRWGVENGAVTTAARLSRMVYDRFAAR